MTRIIKRAGLQPWPKLFHNLRATRETELCQTFPIHVVCEWIGNSAAIAAKHYLRVANSDFERAILSGVQLEKSGAKSGAVNAESDPNALQNPVQTVYADVRQDSPSSPQPKEK